MLEQLMQSLIEFSKIPVSKLVLLVVGLALVAHLIKT